MKFFIDTANLNDIKEAQELGILDGVTTNPSLMAKEGITGQENIINHYKAICAIVDGDGARPNPDTVRPGRRGHTHRALRARPRRRPAEGPSCCPGRVPASRSRTLKP